MFNILTELRYYTRGQVVAIVLQIGRSIDTTTYIIGIGLYESINNTLCQLQPVDMLKQLIIFADNSSFSLTSLAQESHSINEKVLTIKLWYCQFVIP